MVMKVLTVKANIVERRVRTGNEGDLLHVHPLDTANEGADGTLAGQWMESISWQGVV